jgi:hypothetical protein
VAAAVAGYMYLHAAQTAPVEAASSQATAVQVAQGQDARTQAQAPAVQGLVEAMREELKPILQRLDRLEARADAAG